VATLRVYRGDQFVAPFELGEGRTRIGRGTDNHLVLEDHDKQVSRSHAEIWHERGRYVIADLNSQNGVWIGERQIKTEEPLPVDVPVTIGPYRLILMPEEKPVAASTDELDGAAVTGRREAYIEPTQLLEPAAKVPPASQQSHPPKPAAKPSQAAQPGRTHSGKSPAPPEKSRSNTIPIIAAIAALLVLGVVGVVVLKNRGNAPPKVEQTPPAAAVTTSSETTTSVPAPAAPPPEFQEHVSKAEGFIAAGDKTNAAAENAAALALVADDAGAIAQRDRIQQMPNPTPAGQTPPGTPAGKTPVVPAGPETLKAVARPGESEKERASHEKTARAQLEEGRKALGDRQYDAAITALTSAISASNRPDFGNSPGEAAALLRQARQARTQAEAAARHGEAVKALDEARTLVGASDLPAAAARLQRARSLEPDLDGIADLTKNIGDQARTQGDRAFSLAKNHEVGRRTDEAIREYERAIQLFGLIPEGHKDLQAARDRLATLKTGR
jgi:predicted component of type VI protein secretion system